jgi:hypothetical protein
MPVVTKPFSSQYGFKSPGFTVDAQGNIIATSIVAAGAGGGGGTSGTSDYSVTDEIGYFLINSGGDQTPALSLTRNTRFTITLDLSEYTFSIYEDQNGTLYNSGLTHTSTDGTFTEVAAAQGKNSGSLLFTVPASAPSTLYYGDYANGILGTILINDATGLFGELSITSNTNSTSPTTGALTVSGGAGIGGNLQVEGYVATNGLDLNGVGISSIVSNTNLEFDAANKIIIKNNGVLLGSVDSTGISIPINSSSITESTIDDTVIGGTTPAVASFTSASISNVLANKTSVTNKGYVDKTSVAFSIAFGL